MNSIKTTFSRILLASLLVISISLSSWASYILIPMDNEGQKNHLKAYGVTYWVIDSGVEAFWLLNYRGGSFAFPHNSVFEKECKTRGVSYQVISNAQFSAIRREIGDMEVNQEVMKLEKAPKWPSTLLTLINADSVYNHGMMR